MPFLIDGHNLVPKAGFRLADVDVENDLIEKLQVFCRIRRTSVEVYFDGGLPGQPSRGKFGNVTAFFVRRGKTADEAIEKRLQALGKTARNWAVVSSDRRGRSWKERFSPQRHPARAATASYPFAGQVRPPG